MARVTGRNVQLVVIVASPTASTVPSLASLRSDDDQSVPKLLAVGKQDTARESASLPASLSL